MTIYTTVYMLLDGKPFLMSQEVMIIIQRVTGKGVPEGRRSVKSQDQQNKIIADLGFFPERSVPSH